MDFIDQSISNLVSLWKNLSLLKGEYAVFDTFSFCRVADSKYKNRLWLNEFNVKISEELASNLQEAIHQLGPDATLSVWTDYRNEQKQDIINSGFMPVYQQYGMYLIPDTRMPDSKRLQFEKVRTFEQATDWSSLLRQNFKYNIDPEIVYKACGIMSFYIVRSGENQVGTVILHGTDRTLGIHSLGIIPRFRKQGMGDELVNKIINSAIDEGYGLITLQSTSMGQHIYQKVGFKENYLLSHYVSLKK